MRDTKQKIIDAAIIVFNDDPSAALERVADKVPVTRRTLHRYFVDRNALLTACSLDIRKRCSEAMGRVFQQAANPIAQLEQLLYAAIDCGAKYAFFHKLHSSEGHQHQHHNDDCATYDSMQARLFQFFVQLQESGIATKHVTAAWMCDFFAGVVNTAVKSVAMGSVAEQSQKQFAWLTFSRGIRS